MGLQKGKRITMRCARCGRSNRPDAMYCDACGTRFVGPHLPDSLADGMFIGRQAEMGALQAALEDALAGRGRLVLLVGEPGIGKTRIAREFASHTELRGAQVLWGRCHEHEGAPPYWPWIQLIRTYVRVQDAAQISADMGGGAA